MFMHVSDEYIPCNNIYINTFINYYNLDIGNNIYSLLDHYNYNSTEEYYFSVNVAQNNETCF